MRITGAAAVSLTLAVLFPVPCRPAQNEAGQNAALFSSFTDLLLIRHLPQEAFDRYAAEDLIQHNPAARDGRKAAIAMTSPLVTAPDAQFTVSSLIVDGEFGFVHYRGQLGPHGGSAAVAELYRIADGKLAEHWDAFQPVPDHATNPHPMFGTLPRSPPAPCTGATPQDRTIMTGFANLLYVQHQVREAFERYAAPGMIQHDPGLPDGREAAIQELTPLFSRSGTHTTIAHTLACRGYGVIHLRSSYGASPGHVIFDIVRLEGGVIAEHWDVFQPVTEKRINPREPI